jgi:hypothetical protein
MTLINIEVLNALKAANIPEEQAQQLAIALTESNEKLVEKLNKAIDRLDKINDNVHSIERKLVAITATCATALPVLSAGLFFVLRFMLK